MDLLHCLALPANISPTINNNDNDGSVIDSVRSEAIESRSDRMKTAMGAGEDRHTIQQSSPAGSFTVTYDLEYGNADFVAFQHITYTGQVEVAHVMRLLPYKVVVHLILALFRHPMQ